MIRLKYIYIYIYISLTNKNVTIKIYRTIIYKYSIILFITKLDNLPVQKSYRIIFYQKIKNIKIFKFLTVKSRIV